MMTIRSTKKECFFKMKIKNPDLKIFILFLINSKKFLNEKKIFFYFLTHNSIFILVVFATKHIAYFLLKINKNKANSLFYAPKYKPRLVIRSNNITFVSIINRNLHNDTILRY